MKVQLSLSNCSLTSLLPFSLCFIQPSLLDPSDTVLFRVSLALVALLESRLWVPDPRELRSILAGNNRAALSVWRRSQGLVTEERRSIVPVNGNEAEPVNGEESKREAVSESENADESVAAVESSKDESEEAINSEPLKITTSSLNGQVNRSQPPVSPAPTPTTPTPTSASFTSAIEASPDLVPRDNLFSQYGITEELLFRTLEEQESWWKDSTLDRLLNREVE